MTATADRATPPRSANIPAMAEMLGTTREECGDSLYTIGATAVYLLGRAGGIVSNSLGESVDLASAMPEAALGRPDNMTRFTLVRIGGQLLGLAREGEGVEPGNPLSVIQPRPWPRRDRRGTAYLEAGTVELEGRRTIQRVEFELSWHKSLPRRVFDTAREKFTAVQTED